VPDRRRRHRAGLARSIGRERAAYLARRIGNGLRDARRAACLRQRDVAERAGISQPFVSRLERGHGTCASLETIAACAAACGLRLAAFVELAPGADPPRDAQHLRRQELVVRAAATGGWRASPERPVDPTAPRSRSIDVLLERPNRREIAVAEIVDLVTDAGAEMRNLEDKVAAVRRERASAGPSGDPWKVRGLLVLRATRRNRALVRSAAGVFAARFPGRSSAWIMALGRRDAAMPDGDGLVWSTAAGDRLYPSRLG